MGLLQCASCAGRGVRREGGRFVCTWCGQPAVPRLEPGTICGDVLDARPCRALAESLCVGCALPLCARHNDPKRFYWHEPLSWRVLCPGWDDALGAAWHRVQQPLPSLPLPDFAPFPWVHHDREALYRLGQLEDEIVAALSPLARALGGDVAGEAVASESLCSPCETELGRGVREAVARFTERYRDAAFRDRIAALDRELEQAAAYVAAWLGREPRPAEPERGALPMLGADSPREDWEIWAATLRVRREELARLARSG